MAFDDTIKARIMLMRAHGVAYTRIARHLELDVNSVKTFCLRNNITTVPTLHEVIDPLGVWCLHCYAPISLRSGSKFCCEGCRRAWWKQHRNTRSPSGVQTCAQCGVVFEVYGNAKRKFCSHPCYIHKRFGTRGGHK